MGVPQVAVVKTGSGFRHGCRYVNENCTVKKNRWQGIIQGEGHSLDEQSILSQFNTVSFWMGRKLHVTEEADR